MKKAFNTLLQTLKFHKKILIITWLVFLVILIGGFSILMYFEPLFKVNIDTENGTFKISKVPVYDSSLNIKLGDKEVVNTALKRGMNDEIKLEKIDGKYSYTLKIGKKLTNGEFIIDTTPPVITVKYPEYTNSEEIEISFEFNEDTASTKLIDKNNNEIPVVNNKAKVKLISGENDFSIIAMDNYNNESKKEFKIILATSKPIIEILNPTSGETYEGSIDAKIKVTDSTPIDKVLINGQEVLAKDDETYALTINLQEGNNDINFSAIDKAGNTETAQKSINKKTQPVQTYSNGAGNTSGNGGNSGGGNSGGSQCSTALSGSNVYCWNNVNRANAGLGAIGWNDSSANMAYWYAYCLQTTGFSSGNPHQPTQAVKDCLTNNGQPIDRGSFGAEVIASGQGSSDAYANAWKNSPAHAAYVLSPSASNFGVAVYGNWAVGYIQ